MTLPLFSIITPCFNRARLVGEAIESVCRQHDPGLEHIIIDGGSTDGTQEVLRAFPHLKVVSEPDQGMYDAINKGIQLSRGEILGFLNSDDLYADGCFARVREAFATQPGLEALVGQAVVFDDADPERRPEIIYPAIGPDGFWVRIFQGASIFNAWFFRRSMVERLGNFDTTCRTAADREYLIRLALAGIRPQPIDHPFYFYRRHPGSFTITSLDSRSEYGLTRIRHLTESLGILEKYASHPELAKAPRRSLVSAHTELSYQLSATALYHHQWKVAWRAFRVGWHYALFFPAFFVGFAWRRLRQEIQNHRTNSHAS